MAVLFHEWLCGVGRVLGGLDPGMGLVQGWVQRWVHRWVQGWVSGWVQGWVGPGVGPWMGLGVGPGVSPTVGPGGGSRGGSRGGFRGGFRGGSRGWTPGEELGLETILGFTQLQNKRAQRIHRLIQRSRPTPDCLLPAGCPSILTQYTVQRGRDPVKAPLALQTSSSGCSESALEPSYFK